MLSVVRIALQVQRGKTAGRVSRWGQFLTAEARKAQRVLMERKYSSSRLFFLCVLCDSVVDFFALKMRYTQNCAAKNKSPPRLGEGFA